MANGRRLHAAAKSGDVEAMRRALEAGEDVNALNEYGHPAIASAVKSQSTEAVRLLLDHGVDPNFKALNGIIPFFVAVDKGSLDIVKAFLDSGADVNQQDINGDTALHSAVKSAVPLVVEELLRRGAEVNAKNKFYKTALHCAYYYKPEPCAIVEILLSYGAEVNARDIHNRTPLFEAVDGGAPEPVKLLLNHGADINLQDTNGQTVLHFALQRWAEDRRARIHGPFGDLEGGSLRSDPVVNILLEHGAGINIEDNYGLTVLSLAQALDGLGQYESMERLKDALGAAAKNKSHPKKAEEEVKGETEEVAKTKGAAVTSPISDPRDDSTVTLTLKRSSSVRSDLGLLWSRWAEWPRLKAGYRRLEWQCDCGEFLHVDLPAKDAEALNNLASSLQSHGRSNVTPAGMVENNQAQQQQRQNKQQLQQNELRRGSSEQIPKRNPAPQPAGATDSASQAGQVQQKYLALCVDTGGSYKTLVEIETSGINSDEQMFLAIKREYLRLRDRSWIRRFLRITDRVESVHFTLCNLRNGHVSVLKRPDCMPPVDNQDYEYDTEPPIPVPSDVLTHYIEHDEGHLDPSQNEWFPRLPKRLIGRVIDAKESTCGWGLHVIEKSNRMLIGSIWILTILAGYLFAILWSILRHDIQGAMATGTLMASFLVLIMSALQYIANGL